MNEAVVAGCIAVAGLNLIAGLLGLLCLYLGDTSGALPRSFWVMLRVGQGSALALAIAVGSLAAAGHYSDEKLFYLYALLPLAIGFLAEQLRVASAQTVLDQRGLESSHAVATLPEGDQHRLVGTILRREMTVMAISALVVVFLALRAASTAHGF
ncbi:MAG TPA: hypothetical protein VNV44_00395 [Solirubrobacteraceae bacterium]|jgi:hypothetical protein|nr:hypothetical protein [Solirubrobacteraceae bacterium]